MKQAHSALKSSYLDCLLKHFLETWLRQCSKYVYNCLVAVINGEQYLAFKRGLHPFRLYMRNCLVSGGKCNNLEKPCATKKLNLEPLVYLSLAWKQAHSADLNAHGV